MGLDECVIILDSPTYIGGQTINGIVSFVLDEPKKFDGISMKVKGEATVSWSESTTVRGADGKNTTKTTYYTAEESYFNNVWYLVGNESEEMELPIGEYKYPFTYDLPMNIPSSFEGSHGNIRYKIKVRFSRPWKFDYESKVAFTVISPLDLNYINHVKSPARIEKVKTFGCCCCESGPLTLTVAIPQTGFVPGQEIPIQIDCENASRINLHTVKCSIKEVVNFHAHSPYRKTKQAIMEKVKIETNSITAHNTLSSLVMLQIPSIPPTGQRNCRIIDLDYELKISAKPSGLHRDLVIVIPIMIGTIPLVNAWPATNAVQDATFTNAFSVPTLMPSQDQLVNAWPAANSVHDVTLTNAFSVPTPMPSKDSGQPQIGWLAMPSGDCVPSIPPPTYEECQSGTKTIPDSSDFKSASYNPSYPMFPNLPSPSAPE